MSRVAGVRGRPARFRRPALRAWRRVAVASMVPLAAGIGLSSCGLGGKPTITAAAVFPDVTDLAVGAPVQLADINVGSVKSIALDGTEARVTMTIQSSARVPADVTAEVRRTTVLGERFVELVPRPDTPHNAALLADGGTIGQTKVVPELEQLVRGGTQVFGPISANQLGVMLQAGAQGFGGQGAQIHQLLASLSDITAGYAGQTGTIRSLVASLDQFSSATAPDAQADAQAISNLAQTTQIMAAQSDRFNNLLAALNNLSVQSRSLLEAYLPQISDQLAGLAAVTHAIAVRQGDLAQVVDLLKGHNVSAAQATAKRFVQVLDDLVVCGLPGGGDDPSTAAGTCNPGAGS